MIDPNPAEQRAMEAASDRAGEFIGTMPGTDMAQWSAEQWHAFIAVVCGGYVDSLLDQQIDANTAAAKVTG